MTEETNVPKTLMCFPTHAFPAELPLFPGHDAVCDYLKDYAKDLRDMITFNTNVTHIIPSESGSGWTLTLSTIPNTSKTSETSETSETSDPSNTGNVKKEETYTRTYDALIIANGHYNTPFIPSIPGITSTHIPLEHSVNFRLASSYVGKKIILVGNSVSGLDIASQLLPYVSHPLLQSVRTAPETPDDSPVIKTVPQITEFRGDNEVVFADGTVETNVDLVLFCTGYLYTLPFLNPTPSSSTGERVKGTYQHLFSIQHPTLAFLGLPMKVIPFPVSQSQAAVVARVFAGLMKLPGREEMEEWERKRVEVCGDGKGFHNFGYPQDVGYMDWLEEMAEGPGLQPTMWREKERWMRSLTPEIKKAFGRAKKQGVVVRRMEELGYVFEETSRL
jgi:cation diffusion facilitator CzcD-associated flavoprotein CzcO